MCYCYHPLVSGKKTVDMVSNAIELNNIYFSYRTPRKVEFFEGFPLPIKRVVNNPKLVLKDINLNIETNKTTALLGRNGSGKTTLIKLITGTRMPQSGTVRVFGTNPLDARNKIGVCLGGSLIYYRLTARENLQYFARLYGLENPTSKIRELAERLELDDVMDDIVESYSFGMKAKLAIARSLIHDPKLLILDEPTLGIDIRLATELRKFIKNIDCTVLLTTHYMDEAQELADNLCVIEHGEICASGSKEEVLAKYETSRVSEAFLKATGT